MTFKTNAIHLNNDGFNNVEKVSGFVSKEPTVALRHLCLYVSVSTVEKLNLKKFKRVRFSVLKNETFENAEKLYIRPNNDDDGRNRDNYLIVFGKKQLSDGAIISGVKSLYRAVPKLKKYLEYRMADNKRVTLKFCEKKGLYYIQLRPMFDKNLADLTNPPSVPAVYRLSYNGAVQNIGSTNDLKRRLKEKEFEAIPFDQVEYSSDGCDTEEKLIDHEDYHVERYKLENNGKLPPHNHQSVRRKLS